MHNLRSALGRQDHGDDVSVNKLSSSKLYNKSKSASIWALDPDEADGESKQPTKADSKMKCQIEVSLAASFKKDPNFSQMSFYQVLQEIQSKNSTANQMECLVAIESTAHELSERSDSQMKNFLAAFIQCLIRRIKKLRRKQKKHQLNQYDKIVQNNFKKKGQVQFIDEDHPEKKGQLFLAKQEELARKPITSKDQTNSRNDGSSKKNGSSSSTEGKLGKLLSNSKLKEDKKDTNVLASSQQNQTHEDSISFSAVVSQSMAVRQRKPKESVKQKKQRQQQAKHKDKKEQKDAEDEAFIFYRPKAGKKK